MIDKTQLVKYFDKSAEPFVVMGQKKSIFLSMKDNVIKARWIHAARLIIMTKSPPCLKHFGDGIQSDSVFDIGPLAAL